MLMNKWFGAGRFTRDPELRKTSDGVSVADFTLAVNEIRTINNEEKKFVQFLDFNVWSSAAEHICAKAKKGDELVVEGTLRKDVWTNEKDEKRSKTYVRIDKFGLYPKNNSEN